uniref:Small ribosomal subunit protein uS4 N-terminal domain-containing protein n=1 Tax=Kalanchoe fedtschenkoi TaxID=63787 RepID=A0A7N0UNV4_KALFE
MRKLNFHEKKLLKKLIFLNGTGKGCHREGPVMRKYHITGRDDYKKYETLRRSVQKLVNVLKQMDDRDPFLVRMTDALFEKLRAEIRFVLRMAGITWGNTDQKSLALCDHLSVSSFHRWRLLTILARLEFAERFKRQSRSSSKDMSRNSDRNVEDFVTWVDSSECKTKVLDYNNKLGHYDLMN